MPGCDHCACTADRVVRPNIGVEAVAVLAASPYATGLTSLNLDNNWLSPDAAVLLATSPHLAGLCELSLWRNRIGTDGALALACVPFLAGLTRLSALE